MKHLTEIITPEELSDILRSRRNMQVAREQIQPFGDILLEYFIHLEKQQPVAETAERTRPSDHFFAGAMLALSYIEYALQERANRKIN